MRNNFITEILLFMNMRNYDVLCLNLCRKYIFIENSITLNSKTHNIAKPKFEK